MNDPAFLFYPGDYLRDTQCLSENSQVAYDRIMCEHMRNICISKQQLNFFTKRLNDDEKSELFFLLTEISGGFQIKWVSDSIQKRRKYSDSRRKNRSTKPNNISSTYDSHMEIEIENENENINEVKKGITKGKNKFEIPSISEVKAYCFERNNHVDSEDFVNFYSSKGWMIGKNKMKDWKACIRTWEKNKTETNGKSKLQIGKISSSGVGDDYKQSILRRLQSAGG